MAKIFDMDNKYKFFIIAMVVLFLVIVIGTIFFSLFDFSKKEDKPIAVVINDGDLVFNYNEGTKIDSSLTKYSISITNTSDTRVYFSIVLENMVVNKPVSLEILDEEEAEVASYDKLTEADNEILSLLSIEGGETKRFTLHFKGNNKNDFSANIKIVNESNSSRTFADLILLNNEIKTNSTRIGSEVAKEDEGLISSQDDDGITYFFRGDVKNNYVLLGDVSFRIVRINGNGTVRLVLDEGLLTSAYNTKVEEENSTTLLDYTKTSLSTYLEDWVKKELALNTKDLVADYFCVDTDFTNYVNGINYSTAYDRIYLYNSPSLKCEGSRFKALAGLLSIDEVIFAGAVPNKENKSYYLYNEAIEKSYLLTSPYFINGDNDIYLMNVDTNGKLGEGSKINESTLIRPVITISTSAKVKGKGTKNNPYIVVS